MSGRGANGNPEQVPGNDDDDDFGEFGGFEAADPMENVEGEAGQAAAAPWAAIASASASGRTQPDLLCPQNSFPPCLDPSGIAGSPRHAGAGNSNDNAGRPDGDAPLFNARFDDGDGHYEMPERPLAAEGGVAGPMADVVDGTFNSANRGSALNRGGGAAANGMLPDIGLGSNQNPMYAERDFSQNAQSPGEPVPVEVEEQEAVDDLVMPVDPRRVDEGGAVGGGGGGDGGEGDRQQAEAAVQEARAEDEAERGRLQRELASLQSSNLILSQELERSQTDLATQRSRLQEVQRQHGEQLEAARQAGHDALAVVVEEYKELSRTAVLEQQEASQRHLVEVMEQQLHTFQRALHSQSEEEERRREESRRQLQEELATTLESLRTEQQEKFDQHLAEERQRNEETVRQAVEEEQSRCQEQMQEAIASEQRKASEQLQRTKEEYSQQLEEQRRQFESMLQDQCKQERDQAQERLQACLEEERQRGREMTDRALQEARADRQVYLQQQRQNDSAVRRRQLASLDLFLESARRQVDLLLNSDPPHEVAPHPPNPHPHPPPPNPPPPDEERRD